MYFLISSAVMPMPLSLMVMVFAFSSTDTCTVKSPRSLLYCPREESLLIFCVASTALLTSSLRKISLSEYKNFLMMGKMFSVWMDIVPFSATIIKKLENEIDLSIYQCPFQTKISCQIDSRNHQATIHSAKKAIQILV